jgi:glycosyltransferase involved in cell wall biosynthesis
VAGVIAAVLPGSWAECVPDPSGGIQIAELAAAVAVAARCPTQLYCNGAAGQPMTDDLGELAVRRVINPTAYEASTSTTFAQAFGRLVGERINADGVPPDVIHFAGAAAGLGTLDALTIPTPMVVFGVHNPLPYADEPTFGYTADPSEWARARDVELAMLERADVIVSASPSMCETLDRLPQAGGRVHHIPNTIGWPSDRLDAAATAASAVGASILYMGRLAPEKRVDALIDAFELVRQRVPAATLTIAGSGPLEAALRDQARRVGRVACGATPGPGEIAFAGVVVGDRKRALLRAAQVLVCVSCTEVSPVIGYEAMAYGVPVVASDIAPWRELIDDGHDGVLSTCHDAPSIASTLGELLDSPATLRAMSACARRRYASRFAPEIVADTRLHVYERG